LLGEAALLDHGGRGRGGFDNGGSFSGRGGHSGIRSSSDLSDRCRRGSVISGSDGGDLGSRGIRRGRSGNNL
jgi:hypothetical protein